LDFRILNNWLLLLLIYAQTAKMMIYRKKEFPLSIITYCMAVSYVPGIVMAIKKNLIAILMHRWAMATHFITAVQHRSGLVVYTVHIRSMHASFGGIQANYRSLKYDPGNRDPVFMSVTVENLT
jgi:hypothetical protein